MAAFCHFWRVTPDEYWRLTVAEHAAMVRHMNAVAEQTQTQAQAQS